MALYKFRIIIIIIPILTYGQKHEIITIITAAKWAKCQPFHFP